MEARTAPEDLRHNSKIDGDDYDGGEKICYCAVIAARLSDVGHGYEVEPLDQLALVGFAHAKKRHSRGVFGPPEVFVVREYSRSKCYDRVVGCLNFGAFFLHFLYQKHWAPWI